MNHFKQFNEFIKAFEDDNYNFNYWYDDACFIAQSMLSSFSDVDWKNLSDSVLLQSIGYQRRIAYILDNDTEHELLILLQFLKSDDKELIELSIDSLRSFTSIKSKEIIKSQSSDILSAIDKLGYKSPVTNLIVKDFINKFI